MRTSRTQTRGTYSRSRFDRSLAVYRYAFRRARALRFWRVGAVSLLAAGALGLAVELAAPQSQVLGVPLSGSINLADVGSGVAGATFNGIDDNDHAGRSVSAAGDVNGDGLADLVIGAYWGAPGDSKRGESYLVYGQPSQTPLSGSLDLANVGGDLAGATFRGISENDKSGRSVSSAGDVNGDGLDDLLIGSYRTNAGDRWGETYLVYGQPSVSPLSGVLHLANVGAAVAGATFIGILDDDNSHHAVSGAGDVNGDGLADFLSGAPFVNAGGNDRGQSYLVYGQPTGSPLSSWQNMDNVGSTLAGATFDSVANGDQSGFSVSGAGDVNGDGLADFLIGANAADVGGLNRGETYLIYGQAMGSPLSGSLDLGDVGNTVAGATFSGLEDNNLSGTSVSAAGDVNGDGLDDLLIGALRAAAGGYTRGQSYLVYGQPTGSQLSGTLSLAKVGGTLAGAIFNGIDDTDYSGKSVAAAGDVNGDGWDDLLIGAHSAAGAGTNRGETYLVYGQSNINPLSGSLDLADVGGTLAGAIFSGSENYDRSGVSVSAAGDVNGDGLDDFLIGADRANVGGDNRGQTYLVYGQRGNHCRWIAAGSGNWDNSFNWSALDVPVPQDHVFIDPVNGLTVSGPTSATQMRSLTLAVHQAGTANLLVDPAGDLLIDQALTIAAGGRLSGSGTVTAVGGIANQGEIDLGSQGLYVAGGALTNTGLVRGSGTIDNTLVNSTGGEVRVAAGQRMHLTNLGDQFSEGRIDVVGNATQAAEIEFDGELTNNKITGNIAASHATLRFNGGLTNHGDVRVSFGTSNVFGDIDNSEGTIIVSGTSNVTFYDDFLNNGIVKVSKGSTAVYFGSVTGGDDFTGSGTNFFEGNLSPGNSPAGIRFGGDVVLGTGSVTLIELAGTDAGEYDQLLIAGNLEVGGQLQVDLLDGFAPEAGDLFDILDFATLSGSFAAMNLPGLGGGLAWDTSQLSVDGTLCAGACIVPGSGDYNGNGVVDAADYTLWRDTLGSQLDLRADGNGDGTVDEADYVFWNDRFGNVIGTGSEGAVPEPTSALLFTTSLVGLFWRRARRDG